MSHFHYKIKWTKSAALTCNKGVNFLNYVALMNITFEILSSQEHCDINVTTVIDYWTELIDFISVSEIVC